MRRACRPGKHEASALAASRAPDPPSGPLLGVCDRWRTGGKGGESDGVESKLSLAD